PRDQDQAVARYDQPKVVVATNVAETSIRLPGFDWLLIAVWPVFPATTRIGVSTRCWSSGSAGRAPNNGRDAQDGRHPENVSVFGRSPSTPSGHRRNCPRFTVWIYRKWSSR